MNTNPKPPALVIAAGHRARHLTAMLHDALNTKEQWLDREMAGALKVTVNPYLKHVINEVCADRRIPMVDYTRKALIAAMKRDLAADIAEMEALDAPLKMTLESEDADVLAVKVRAA